MASAPPPYAHSQSTPAKGSSTRQTAPGNSLAGANLQEDIGATVPIISVQRFFDHVFPPLPAVFSLEDIVDRLKNSSKSSYNTTEKGWTVFLKSKATSENQHYRGLFAISQVVIRAVGHLYPTESKGKMMDFVNSPNSAPFSDWRDSRHRPDGYFIFHKKRSGEHLWRNMGPTGEYKLASGERIRLDVSLVFCSSLRTHRATEHPQSALEYVSFSARRSTKTLRIRILR